MTERPLIIDAYCGAGGSSVGFYRAGFDVVGIDSKPQPHYPFMMIEADIPNMDLVDLIRVSGAVALVGGPPCKVHTTLKSFSGKQHLNLIPSFRAQCVESGLPYIIENVPGAPLLDPITLCGSSFDLGVRRHRIFESNVAMTSPGCDHPRQILRSPGYPVRRYNKDRGGLQTYISPTIGVYGGGQGLGDGEVQLWHQAMGISWMNRRELAEAIPPAYTSYLGRQLMNWIMKWQTL